MREALKATLGKKGMGEEEIAALADYLISFFGYNEEVIDNHLDVQDRDVFYMLEEEGLLGTRQEEVHIKKGKLWRIHYWVLKTDKIKKLAANKERKEEEDYSSIYGKISEEIWTRE